MIFLFYNKTNLFTINDQYIRAGQSACRQIFPKRLSGGLCIPLPGILSKRVSRKDAKNAKGAKRVKEEFYHGVAQREEELHGVVI